MSRRRFLGALGAAGVAVAAVGAGAAKLTEDDEPKGSGYVPFYGPHQSGIGTASQDRLHIAAFDLITARREDVQKLLQDWSKAAALLCEGKPVGAVSGTGSAPPDDTGEQVGLKSSRLTITVGFGPGLFMKNGTDRYGLAAKKPAGLEQLPAFNGDALNPDRSEGDLVIQACSDDPQVVFHAVHNMARIARGVAVMKWAQFGFGRTSSTSSAQKTPRNLMGSIDGTNNIKGEDHQSMNTHVWVGSNDGPDWMTGGTYMVTRRIRMLLEIWDRSSLDDQEQTIGRHKATGAPLSKKTEFDTLDFNARDAIGEPVIPMDAHVRIAHPDSNSGSRILRRGYSFTDGIDPKTGQLDAGLFFISFQRSVAKQLIPIQENLSKNDKLNEYIRHNASAVFAVPPGIERDDYFGSALFQ